MITDKKLFECMEASFEGRVAYISVSENQLEIKRESLYSIFLDINELAHTEWSHESKQYPPPEPEFLPVPDFLKNWSHETIFMGTYSKGVFWTPIHIAQINKLRGDDEFYISSFNSNLYSIAKYDKKSIGTHNQEVEFVTFFDIAKMNPKELSHIPGHFYKEEVIK